jgi:hypothetical protein
MDQWALKDPVEKPQAISKKENNILTNEFDEKFAEIKKDINESLAMAMLNQSLKPLSEELNDIFIKHLYLKKLDLLEVKEKYAL